MDLVLNSVWKVGGSFEELQSGKYRVIAIYPSESSVALYALLEDKDKIIKPCIITIDSFSKGVNKQLIISSSFETPGFMLLHEGQLDNKDREQRDSKFKLIEPLVTNTDFIFQYATQQRCKLLSTHARNEKKSPKTLYRYLRDYWRYGMAINALLDAFPRCGGIGVDKTFKNGKVGRPVKENRFGFSTNAGKNVTEEDKKKILKGYIKFYASGSERSLAKAYEHTKSEFYSDEIRKAALNGLPENIPTKRQFGYWGRKLSSAIDVEVKRKPKGDYERNQRGLENSVSASTSGPGDYYELDATTADVHIVLELNRHYCIGRPFIYAITDRASRMIVGFYVCLENPSWYSASLAISNAFMHKVEYCSKFGVQISEDQWPCFHIPATLVCDRGEMKGKAPAAIIPKLGPVLQLLPPFRPDMKSIVERRFGILNEEVIHDLDGTTKGRFLKRGEIDPREKAIYTLKELTEILLRKVLKHNNDTTFDELRTQELIEANLEPTPLNFWNFYVNQKNQHSLQEKPEEDVKALLLPEVTATVTKYGIRHGDIYYICKEAQTENWLTTARTQGYWKIEARFDENTPDLLWIRPQKGERFVRCTMLPRSKVFKGLTYPDILYVSEWSQSNKKTATGSVAELDNYERNKEIKKHALNEKGTHIAPNSKREKTKNIRKNRGIEKERIRNERYEKGTPDNIVKFPTKKKTPNYNDDTLDLISNLWEEPDDEG